VLSGGSPSRNRATEPLRLSDVRRQRVGGATQRQSDMTLKIDETTGPSCALARDPIQPLGEGVAVAADNSTAKPRARTVIVGGAISNPVRHSMRSTRETRSQRSGAADLAGLLWMVLGRRR